jgi:hypothetical protein
VGGGTEASALRVTIANNSTGVLSVDDNGGALTVDGTVTAELSATDNAVLDNIALYTAGSETALELLDNAVDGNYLNTNMNVAGTDVAAGSGVISAQTLRVTIATDDPVNDAMVELSGAIDTEMQCDIVGSLPAGTNAIGKLSANSGVDIGDVDVTSIIPGTGATNLGKAEDAAHTTADTGVYVLGVRDDVLGVHSGADGDYESFHLDAQGGLYTRHAITGIGHGVTTVTTAGTDVALAGSTVCKRVTIQAQTDNTSSIAVGGSGVDATIATGTGIVLYAGDVFELEVDNLADVYIDSLVNGEGVRYTYFT